MAKILKKIASAAKKVVKAADKVEKKVSGVSSVVASSALKTVGVNVSAEQLNKAKAVVSMTGLANKAVGNKTNSTKIPNAVQKVATAVIASEIKKADTKLPVTKITGFAAPSIKAVTQVKTVAKAVTTAPKNLTLKDKGALKNTLDKSIKANAGNTVSKAIKAVAKPTVNPPKVVTTKSIKSNAITSPAPVDSYKSSKKSDPIPVKKELKKVERNSKVEHKGKEIKHNEGEIELARNMVDPSPQEAGLSTLERSPSEIKIQKALSETNETESQEKKKNSINPLAFIPIVGLFVD